MHTRQNALNKWLHSLFGDTPFTLIPLAGDASFRRYYRLHCGELIYVVMDAPPDKETITPFINIGNRLKAVGVHTPTVFSVEPSEGFILLEDMGDQLLLQALSHNNADSLYQTAITTLLQIQQCKTTNPALPAFDKAFMLKEIALFREWFLQAYLGLKLNTHESVLLENTFEWLTTQIAKQPQVFIHRDYHSRNLMIIDKNGQYDMGVLDFQDAMSGPYTYDLVSLLKDCYIQWPREKIMHWLTQFYHANPIAQSESFSDFIRAFDWCGLQRHLKVLGIFCRLHLRDHKPAYLHDLPLTFNYVNACLESYSELQPFHHFMQQRVYLPFAEKSQS